MKSSTYIVLILGLFLSLNNSVLGAEIQYAQVEDVYGSGVHIKYRGPGDEQNFVCDVINLECEAFGTSTPSLFPKIDGEGGYSKSPDGKYGIIKTVIGVGDDDKTYIHSVYDISGSSADLVEVVPYFKNTTSYRFSWGGGNVMLFGTDGSVVTFDIKMAEMRVIDLNRSDLPMRSLSPYAGYLSSYSYIDEEHHIWNTKTGEMFRIPSKTADYVEFSQNERYAVFVDDSEGYKTLHLVDLETDVDIFDTVRVFKDNFTVEDYIFFKNDLYVVGNTEEDPYRWVLYRYDTERGEEEIVAEDVSYADYMRPAGERGLLFLQIDGKSTHVAMYRSDSESVHVFKPVNPSPASQRVKRSVVSFDRAKGVLYEPVEPGRNPDLFIWLHGGPRRQASFGYHSYLSYAVYDEFLERLVEGGAYVLKLDYAGSFGHGNELMDALMHSLGVADVEDVIDASKEISDLYDLRRVYLIGNSYGGYLGPRALVERPEMFEAVVAINGVFDWFTLLERIPSSPFSVYFQGSADLEDLENNFDLYRKASILRKASNLGDQKVVLVYGESDSTVPTWQTREFFYIMEALGKNIEVLELRGEGHVITERESLDIMCDFIASELSLNYLDCN